MGDILSPKRKDLVERLRRRIDLYRRTQNGALSHYTPNVKGLYEGERRETLLLHQKWLESKAKKASKSKSKDSNSTGESKNRSKRKADAASTGDAANNNNLPDLIHDGLPHSPVGKKPRANNNHQKDGHEKNLPQVSVQIVQQINQEQEPTRTIQTNVTFSSTIKTNLQGGGRGADSSSLISSSSIQANVECKQEPPDDVQSSSSSHTSDSLTNFGVDIDELQAILDNLEKEDGEIPDFDKFADALNSLKEPDELEEQLGKEQLLGGVVGSTNTGTVGTVQTQTMSMSKPGSKMQQNSAFGSVGGVGSTDVQSHTPPVNTMMGMAPNSSLPPGYPQQTHPIIPPVLINETGPAAETLKQMAAQHQQQQHQDYDPLQKIPPSPYQYAGHSNRYPAYSGFNTGQEQMYPAYNQPARHMNNYQNRPGMNPTMQQMNGKDPSLNYGATKPLTHYGDPNASMSSSLQQLQNQVQSHFNTRAPLSGNVRQGGMMPSRMPQMEMSQSQHVHVSHGVQRLHMRQSQQMHISNGQAQQISLAQQQSFSMTQQQYMQDRRRPTEQMVGRQQHHSYMNRSAPPDYKAAMSNQNSYHNSVAGVAGNMNRNPLQTMQNMVNQTSQPPQTGDMYHVHVKSELQQSQHNVPMSGHMSATQGGTAMPPGGGGQQPPMYSHSMSQMQQNAQHTGTDVMSQPIKTEQGQYTSAIMRNHRPPNVNVGPDGLSLSRQRTNCPEWTPKGHIPEQTVPDVNMINQSVHSSNNMYGNYGQQQSSSSPHLQMQQCQNLQAGVTTSNQQQMGAPPNQQQQQQVMMRMHQQQQMHLQQQQTGHSQPAPMSTSVAMTTTSHSSNNTSNPNSDLMPLDFFGGGGAGAPPPNGDFFDSTNPSDFNLIDELFAGK
ncbi:uncharacterized protein LOC141905574 [Tubulanus polymorphus]|uniref:uncharacterized protein LOC141905574 n=1 Tax=Tubulanus polymorphus TaxID=672921 RepID=UPI003DA210F2